MTSNPVRSQRARSIGLAGSLAILVGSTAACTAVGRVSGPGTGQGTGVAGNGPGTGNGGTGPGTGTGGTGGIVAIPNNGQASSNTSWYDTLKATDCTGAPTALPSSRIWRLSATQWANTVAAALGVSAPDVSAFPPDQLDPRTGYNDDSTGDKITLGLASSYFDKSDAAATQAAPTVIAANACLGQTPDLGVVRADVRVEVRRAALPPRAHLGRDDRLRGLPGEPGLGGRHRPAGRWRRR